MNDNGVYSAYIQTSNKQVSCGLLMVLTALIMLAISQTAGSQLSLSYGNMLETHACAEIIAEVQRLFAGMRCKIINFLQNVGSVHTQQNLSHH